MRFTPAHEACKPSFDILQVPQSFAHYTKFLGCNVACFFAASPVVELYQVGNLVKREAKPWAVRMKRSRDRAAAP